MAVEKKKPEAPLSDKKKALETAISQIEKNFGKGTVMRLGDRPEMNVEAIPTGSLALDAALGIGGVPKGRIIEIYGPEASGKTTLALHIVARRRSAAVRSHSSTRSTRWTLTMRRESAWTSTPCSSPIRIPASRLWRLQMRSSARVRWTWWLSTLSRR